MSTCFSVFGIGRRVPPASRLHVLALLFVGMAAWTMTLPVSAETVGDRFRRAMRDLEKYCNTYELKPNDRSCDPLKLQPADPYATPEGRFAHSIKLPAPHDKPKELYRKGMTSKEYFDALCKAEAGEFVFRTVANVDGILRLRPRQRATDHMQMHLYALEDPFGYTDWEAREPQTIFVNPPWALFKVFESLRDASQSATGGTTVRFSGYDQRSGTPMKYETVDSPISRYAYTWRGVQRASDRELGIAGGELIILDMTTLEVVAFRRGFARTGGVRNVSTGVWWLTAEICPMVSEGPGQRVKSGEWLYRFVSSVLKPAGETNGEAPNGK